MVIEPMKIMQLVGITNNNTPRASSQVFGGNRVF